MADVFREVDEEVKREQYLKLAKRFGPYLIAAAVALVVATGAVVGWRDYQKRTREADGARFAAAIEVLAKGERAKAADAFADLAKDGSTGYRALAGLQRAAAVGATDAKQAVEIYDGIAKDSSLPELLRSLAALRAAMMQADSVDAKDVLARLEPLLGETSPWRFLARELKAVVEIRGGNDKAAIETLKGLVDNPQAPSGIRGRAAQLLAALEAGK